MRNLGPTTGRRSLYTLELSIGCPRNNLIPISQPVSRVKRDSGSCSTLSARCLPRLLYFMLEKILAFRVYHSRAGKIENSHQSMASFADVELQW